MSAERRLAPGYEARLDAVLARALDNPVLNLPGFVAMARRGASVYGPKAFGMADVAAGRPMRPDAMLRMYSMTKVLTSTVALMLYEKGLLRLDDPVGQHLPAFDRAWTVVREADGEPALGEVAIRSLATGRAEVVRYAGAPARNVMRIRHLMTETSGIGYDLWGDTDDAAGGRLGTRRAFHIASGLRRRVHPQVYASSCILGQDVDLAGFCDAIARAGVLATEPGQYSYGLGATVLGRVIEVAWAKHTGAAKPLSAIFAEMLFRPLGMRDAAFFLADGDPRAARIPALYGVRVGDAGPGAVVPAAESVPPAEPPYSNGTDHAAGPRRQESGDTGTLMPVADYARFLDFLARGGVTEQGERLLSPVGVQALTGGWLAGLDLDTPLARHVNLAGLHNPTYPCCFSFGWAIARPAPEVVAYAPGEHPAACFWRGYAHTNVTYFRGEDAWIITAPQVMDHGPAGPRRVHEVLTKPAVAAFLDLWR